ncbi:MAG: pantoate--beta-alanine ligase [Silvanigrellaceae bacterium]
MGILVARTRSELRSMIASLKSTLEDAGVRPQVGFVPTMGALHQGHATLVRRSSKENSITVVSIFVNPKQFSVNEDLDKYPRTFESDCALCESAGAQLVFAPSNEEMYPPDFKTSIGVRELGDVLCGAYRPGHFDGVCTVVMLLLNLVLPEKAYFGLKDFQQFAIVSRMMRDLEHRTRIIGVPTVREQDGLAMSSRNKYLDAHSRQTAACIPRALCAGAECFLSGVSEVDVILAECREHLRQVPDFELQYLEIRSAKTLSSVESKISSESVLAIAGFAVNADGGKTRLIDNILLTHDPDHLEALLDFVRLVSKSR